MRPLGSSLAVLLVTMGVSTGASADDRRDCEGRSYELRIAACTQILSANPADFSALANRGIGYRGTGEYDRALADLEAAMRINPRSAGLYLERGHARAGKGHHTAAIVDFNEALRRDPSLMVAYFARAMAYEDTGQQERAKVDLSEAMRRAPEMVAALYMQRGYALKKSRDFDKAIAAFDKTIDLNPNWLSAYFGRGASHEEKGDRELAAADYRKTLEFKATTELERQRLQSAREQLEKLSRGS
jgi:tetratricopeptide (TPR) repeat protein